MENFEEILEENLVSSSFQGKGKGEKPELKITKLARMAKIRKMPSCSSLKMEYILSSKMRSPSL